MMHVQLPRLYAITDLALAGANDHADVVQALLKGGCRCIQLREKQLPDDLLYEQLQRCLALCASAGATLLVNDRVDLAWAAGAPGVHLGQDDLSPGAARRVLGNGVLIGLSTHTLEQAQRAEADPAVDYVAAGPVFPTGTKPSANPPLGLEGLASFRRQVRKPMVAIGGITPQRAADVLRTGCDTVAVISALMRPNSIAAETERMLARLASV